MAKNANFVSHKKSKLKNQDGSPKLPLATDIVEGEIAINFGKDVETLSIKNESGNVVTFSSDNYYTEQKLGSGFTSENSGRTVTNAFFALSGTVSAHTENTEIHVTAADKEKLHTHSNKAALDSITGNVGTMAYENADSYSSATEVNTALADKSDKGHEHGSNSISAMTNYQIASSASSISTSDTLNEAIGKLEKRLALLEAALKVQSNGDVYGDAEEY